MANFKTWLSLSPPIPHIRTHTDGDTHTNTLFHIHYDVILQFTPEITKIKPHSFREAYKITRVNICIKEKKNLL